MQLTLEIELLPAAIGAAAHATYRLLQARSRPAAVPAAPAKSIDEPELLCSATDSVDTAKCQQEQEQEAPSAEAEPEPEASPGPAVRPGDTSERPTRSTGRSVSHWAPVVGLVAFAAWILGEMPRDVLFPTAGLGLEEERSATAGPSVPSRTIAAEWKSEMESPHGNFSAVPATESKSEAERQASNLITVNLTRQRIATQTMGDITIYKSAYWGTMNVGTPPEPFKVVFDTGSGHLILPSTYCHSETCRVHKRYRRAKSATAVDIDYDGSVVQPGEPRDQITVSFGTGEVTGIFIEDLVCMDEAANSTQPNRQLVAISAAQASGLGANRTDGLSAGCVKLRFIAATEVSEDPFKAFHFDGVMGLGLPGLSQAPEFNFMGMMAQAIKSWGGRRPQTFAVFLAESKQEESQITLGGWNEDRLASELTWSAVHEPHHGHWMVRIRSLRVDDKPLAFCQNADCNAVADTGTSLLAMPTAVFPELFELLRHAAPEEGHCRGPGPNLHIELEGGFVVTLEPRDYARLYRPLSKQLRDPPLSGPGSNHSDKAYCKPMLMAMDLPAPVGPKLFILGEPILRKYYTVYDGEAGRIGFGLALHRKAPADGEAASGQKEEDSDDELWDDEV